MYVYNLGYYTYEESGYIQLYHKNKYAQKEFEEIIAKATLNILKTCKDKGRTTFQDIFFSLKEELIRNFGFKKVKFNAEFSVFGWADILDEKDWQHDRDEQLNKLTMFLKKNVKYEVKK